MGIIHQPETNAFSPAVMYLTIPDSPIPTCYSPPLNIGRKRRGPTPLSKSYQRLILVIEGTVVNLTSIISDVHTASTHPAPPDVIYCAVLEHNVMGGPITCRVNTYPPPLGVSLSIIPCR